ncbi:hypothetical protein TNCT_96901 [Trichonephila clavata]|uniref:Uncharacterized protein n=1 Tax=Trichonephila clavata TaxID=2740835 RepID=A0A8X6H3V8_TRICU|nr:hypothetical protein TNCT_96901 [Trichonephila clavata]
MGENLKEEDRLNVQRELDKPVKRTASVSSNNSTGSNEVSKLQPKRRKIEKPAPTVIVSIVLLSERNFTFREHEKLNL